MKLEFYTNEELVKELLSRTTFAGIIVKLKKAIEEVKVEPYIEFDMFWSPVLTENAVQTLLEKAVVQLKGDNDV